MVIFVSRLITTLTRNDTMVHIPSDHYSMTPAQCYQKRDLCISDEGEKTMHTPSLHLWHKGI